MWALLLPLGLGSALLTPGPPALSPRGGPGDVSGGCQLCHSPHRGRAVANGTLGASVTLGCPVAGAPLGQLLAVHWHFWGVPGGGSVPVCSQTRGLPRCSPPYGDRATLLSPPGPPGGLLMLGGLREGDAGTYSCLLLGQEDCACGDVTLRLEGAPCSPPCSGAPPGSGAPPRGSFSLGFTVLFLLLLLLLLLVLPPARGL